MPYGRAWSEKIRARKIIKSASKEPCFSAFFSNDISFYIRVLQAVLGGKFLILGPAIMTLSDSDTSNFERKHIHLSAADVKMEILVLA